MRLLIYKPAVPAKKGSVVLWIHGGGYAFGAPEGASYKSRRLMEESGAVIVSPDYRLSLEKPYPVALDDCYLALLWLRDHAEDLGGRSDQLMVGGESAGGGLAAAVTLSSQTADRPPQGLVPSGWALCEASKPDGSTEEKSVPIESGVCRVCVSENTDTELLAKVCKVLMSLC